MQTIAPSPFRNRKSLDDLLAVAKDLAYFQKAKIGQGQTPGQPFQGPSGRWFVVRPSDGRVVPTKNPGGSAPTPASGGSPAAAPANTPAAPSPNPAPQANPNPPANPSPAGGGSSPSSGSNPTKAQTQAFMAVVQPKLVAGQGLSAQELTDLPAHLQNMTGPQLIALKKLTGAVVISGAGTNNPTNSWSKKFMVSALLNYAQGLGSAPPPVTPPVIPPVAQVVPGPTPPNTPVAVPVNPPAQANPAPINLPVIFHSSSPNAGTLTQQAFTTLLPDLIAKNSLSPTDSADLISNTPNLTWSEADRLCNALGIPLQNTRTASFQAIQNYIRGLGTTGGNSPAPTPVVPPSPVVVVPTPVAGSKTPPATAPAPPRIPPPRTVTASDGISGGTYNKDNDDRDLLDDLVADQVQKLGIDPNTLDRLPSNQQYQILNGIKRYCDSSVDTSAIRRSLNSLHTQLCTKLIPVAIYGHGNKRAKNYNLDDAARPKLKRSEKLALQKYTGTCYRDLNKTLRETGQPTQRTAEIHKDLQSAFKTAQPLASPTNVVRGLTLDASDLAAMTAALQGSKNAGTPHKFNSYLSCSTNSSPPSSRTTPNVVMRIKAVHGLDVKPYSHCPQANELLLDCNSEFDIKDVSYDSYSGQWVVQMEQKLPSTNPSVATVGVPKAPKVAKTPKAPKPGKPHKFKGVDSSSVVKDILSGAKTYDLHYGIAGGKEDVALTDIMKESGRAEKPKVLDSAGIDDLRDKQGWKVFYRGVKPITGKTGADLTTQFRTGDLYNGAGIYGNGTYMMGSKHSETRAEQNARGYANSSSWSSSPGEVMRIAVPPTAKFILESTLKGKRRKYQQELDNKLNAGTLSYQDHRKLTDLSNDLGRFATLMNYDGIRVGNNGDYHVLLNRTIAAVQDRDV